MIGPRIGPRIGGRKGPAIGMGQDQIAPSGGFTGFGLVFGDSNAVGIANYNASGQSDSSYGVSDSVGYAPVTMNSHYATAIADPITWNDTGTETLRAYAAPPASNMGQEQTLGRHLYWYGIASAPVIIKYGLSGATQHTHFRTDSTSPVTGGNIHAQMVAYVQARQAEFGRQLDFAVYVLGENDCSNSTNANATQADMTNIIGGLRTALGRPDLPVFVILVNSATTGTFTSTVRSQQVTYVASDSLSRGIYVDDITLASNPHYGANGYYDVGSRVADAVARYFFPNTIFNLGSGTIPWYQDAGAGYTTAASPATAKPRSGADCRDGDFQLLVATSQATAATFTLTTAAGFTQLGSQFESLFGGTNHRQMAVWWRLVDQATLDANNGTMPDPVLDPSTVATTVARIFTFRGPNKWVANPIDLNITGANNANNTTLVIPTGTTAAANELAVIFCSVPGTGTSVTSCVNANLTNISKKWDGLYQQSSVIGLALHTASIPTSGTATGNTTITMSGSGVNVGCLITLKP